eukprot:1161252-Pelagomonas_calceolata.AAC.4
MAIIACTMVHYGNHLLAPWYEKVHRGNQGSAEMYKKKFKCGWVCLDWAYCHWAIDLQHFFGRAWRSRKHWVAPEAVPESMLLGLMGLVSFWGAYVSEHEAEQRRVEAQEGRGYIAVPDYKGSFSEASKVPVTKPSDLEA